MSLSNLANASDEKKMQRIMTLRRLFDLGKIKTVKGAQIKFGYSESTIRSWCKQGNIPLYDNSKQTYAVPLTFENQPKWVEK